MNTMFRRPMGFLSSLMALAAVAGASSRSTGPMPAEDTGRRRRITPMGFRQRLGIRLPDYQRQASLRRRMGGNAQRIVQARQGFIWSDASGWVPSPRVLPEEVEQRVKDWGTRPRNGFGQLMKIRTEIRGMEVEIYPTFCGPVRFKQLEVAA